MSVSVQNKTHQNMFWSNEMVHKGESVCIAACYLLRVKVSLLPTALQICCSSEQIKESDHCFVLSLTVVLADDVSPQAAASCTHRSVITNICSPGSALALRNSLRQSMLDPDNFSHRDAFKNRYWQQRQNRVILWQEQYNNVHTCTGSGQSFIEMP